MIEATSEPPGTSCCTNQPTSTSTCPPLPLILAEQKTKKGIPVFHSREQELFGDHWKEFAVRPSAGSPCQDVANREVALRQLTRALRLTRAPVNIRQGRVISSCGDECLASSGTCPREDCPLHILHTAPYSYKNTRIVTDSPCGDSTGEETERERRHKDGSRI